MSPSMGLSTQVSTRATMFCASIYPLTLALFGAVNVTTVYFFPPIDFDETVASFIAASRRNPCGVIHRSTCTAHGVFGPITTLCVGPGGRPPPLRSGGTTSSTRSTRHPGVSKLMVRVYDLSAKAGQG